MHTAPISFHDRIESGLHNEVMRGALGTATSRFAANRLAALATLPDADAVRDRAAAMRRHTLARLDQYLVELAASVERAGGVVHWAADAAAAQRIVAGIAQANHARTIVKAKSMVTEEIHLNAALEAVGLRVIETDLGEYIAQLSQEAPSHIIAPVLHKTRQEIGRLFQQKLGVEYVDDPTVLAGIARRVLRQIFLEADMGISGVNFAVASTGTLALVTNEGNGRMVTSLPRIHVAVMGIERVVPTPDDLALILQLLARSATGQKLSVYTSLLSGPRRAADPDGPQQLHLVLVDNGRSGILQSDLAEILTCIRCGACLNICPVYRSIGGHAYGSTYPGPVGSVLSPLLSGLGEFGELAHASSLCGACREVCPVRIDLPGLLLKLRHDTVQAGQAPAWLRFGMKVYALGVTHPWLYRLGGRLAAIVTHMLAHDGWIRRLPGPLVAWSGQRDFPVFAPRTFQDTWAQRRKARNDDFS
ncbi:LutB/LldF family L-lactate oxidation iron-sulfur protein [Candidatus Amarolinea aalborgensis]|uniref:LutB/LldF family L-lactate oxidation iron-sulfur protein n=1 Tax=Candidatus Amarolinea aalborgensis TaxID=2249329 RepID=UPI003BF942F7